MIPRNFIFNLASIRRDLGATASAFRFAKGLKDEYVLATIQLFKAKSEGFVDLFSIVALPSR